MKAMAISAICFLSVSYLVIIFTAIYSGKFFKRIILSAVFGLLVLGIIDLTAKFTGVYIPINAYTVVGSAGFGIPAITAFLILPLII